VITAKASFAVQIRTQKTAKTRQFAIHLTMTDKWIQSRPSLMNASGNLFDFFFFILRLFASCRSKRSSFLLSSSSAARRSSTACGTITLRQITTTKFCLTLSIVMTYLLCQMLHRPPRPGTCPLLRPMQFIYAMS